MPLQHLPPVCPGLEPTPAAAGWLTAPTPRAPALPQPGEAGCFPVCLLPLALIPGTGDSDSQAAVPAGASLCTLTPQGLSRTHVFLILLPQEGLEPAPSCADRSVPTLCTEGLGTRAGGVGDVGRLQKPRSC